MKRYGLKVFTAAAVLTMGLVTMNAYAAEGWALSNNSWVYQDASGRRVTNEWKRGADNLWRYLNDKGEMAINTWADEEYFVDSNGIMVSNQWVKTTPQFDDGEGEKWFYFGSSGKAVKDGWKKIDGRSYYFDDEGIMATGWSEDYLYFLGDDGAMKTGWRYIEAPRDDYDWDNEEWDEYQGPESSDGKYWFYFGANGKKYCPETSSDKDAYYRVNRIGDSYYCFDEYGRMMTGWVYMEGDREDAPTDSIENWRYFAEAGLSNMTLGANVQGWLSLEVPEELQDNVDEPVLWYYFQKEGKPEIGPEYGDASTSDFVRVNGNYYLFDKKGNPVSGLHQVEIGSTGELTSYYFDHNSKAALKGQIEIKEGDGTESEFYFNEGSYSGRGVTGVKDNYLYYMGKRQMAEDGYKYQAIDIPSGSGYKTYVVSESGRVVKNKSVKDSDGVKYTTNKSGILTHIDEEAVGTGENGVDPVEPTFEEWDA